MALSITSLTTRIENGIAAAFSVSVNPDMHKYASAMATAIITEITANAKVSVGITVTSTGTDAISGAAVNSTGSTTTQGSIV